MMIRPSDLGFPAKFANFRSYPGYSQWQTASDMASAASDFGFRFIGNCSPVGSGKSLCQLTTARILDSGRTLYLTINKSLQNQLVSDFGDSASSLGMYNLTGHSSYPCAIRSMHSDTDAISSIECTDRENCGYWRDVRESLTHDLVTSNFANWISIARAGDPDRFGHFSTLILDEAHNLESVLCDLLAVRFSRRSTYELIKRNLPQNGEPLPVWIEWASECSSVAFQALSNSRQRDRDESNGRESIDTKRLGQLLRDLLTVSAITDEWAVEPKPYGAQLTPAFAENYAEDYLFRGIPTVILSSATITPEDFAYLGIPDPNFKLFDIQSGFPPERRPFYYWPKTPIDYNSVEGQLIQTVNRYDQIIEPRLELGWKCLIHSVSYYHAQTIAKLSRHPILTHSKSNAQSVIRDWMSNPKPQVLASPVMSEGVDLAHDLCRCQFIWKIPIPYSGDPLISIRKKRRPKYTLYLAAKTMQQMYGRVMRAGLDFGETWITDSNWGKYMRRSVQWPVSFRSAWKTIDRLPDPLDF
jgi:ATP-dependent DNA helicase DinG